MTDTKSREQRSENMRRVRRRDSIAEISLRRAVHRLGGRYRVDDGTVIGRPDLCFRRAKIAVFVDSTFWHGRLPRSRLAEMTPFWQEKLARNRRRDVTVNRSLSRAGWLVIRVDERSALKRTDELAVYILGCVSEQRSSGRVIRLDHPLIMSLVCGAFGINS